MVILVDTSAWIALESQDDARHAEASAFWESAVSRFRRILITPWILSESVTNIARKAGSERAFRFGKGLLDSRFVELAPSGPEVASRALLVMRQRNDPKFSFADAASWVIAREYGVNAVFAFDRHLRIPGIRLLPEDEGWAVSERRTRYRVRPSKPAARRRPGRRRPIRMARISSITASHSASEL